MTTAPQLDFLPTMPAFLRRIRGAWADADFVVSPQGRLTYAQADERSNRIARRLLADGVVKGTRIGFVFGNGPEWVLTWLAITRIGAVAMPFSTMYTGAELYQVLALADAEVLISPVTLLGRDQVPFLEAAVPGLADSGGPHHLECLPLLRRVMLVGEGQPAWADRLDLGKPEGSEGKVTEPFLRAVEDAVHPADTMLTIFTSGTTAEPKAVLHTHGAWVRHTSNVADNSDEPYGGRTYGGMPFFWVGGVSSTLGPAMHRGSAVLCMEKPDIDAMATLLEEERCTKLLMWPSQAARVTEQLRSGHRPGGALPPFMQAVEGPPVDAARQTQSLGMTETLAAYIVGGAADHVIPDDYAGAHGLRVPHLQYRITQPETGEVLDEGQEGEICVRGYSLMVGMAKLERHEYLDDDGWYHTGDRGSLKGPYVYFSGRIKDLIKSSGANVSPREVEAVINQAEGVMTSVVVAIPDPVRQEIVGAVVTPRSGAELEEVALAAHCRRLLSAYKVPRLMAVVADSDLPLLPTGKVNGKEVIALLLARGVAV